MTTPSSASKQKKSGKRPAEKGTKATPPAKKKRSNARWSDAEDKELRKLVATDFEFLYPETRNFESSQRAAESWEVTAKTLNRNLLKPQGDGYTHQQTKNRTENQMRKALKEWEKLKRDGTNLDEENFPTLGDDGSWLAIFAEKFKRDHKAGEVPSSFDDLLDEQTDGEQSVDEQSVNEQTSEKTGTESESDDDDMLVLTRDVLKLQKEVLPKLATQDTAKAILYTMQNINGQLIENGVKLDKIIQLQEKNNADQEELKVVNYQAFKAQRDYYEGLLGMQQSGQQSGQQSS